MEHKKAGPRQLPSNGLGFLSTILPVRAKVPGVIHRTSLSPWLHMGASSIFLPRLARGLHPQALFTALPPSPTSLLNVIAQASGKEEELNWLSPSQDSEWPICLSLVLRVMESHWTSLDVCHEGLTLMESGRKD